MTTDELMTEWAVQWRERSALGFRYGEIVPYAVLLALVERVEAYERQAAALATLRDELEAARRQVAVLSAAATFAAWAFADFRALTPEAATRLHGQMVAALAHSGTPPMGEGERVGGFMELDGSEAGLLPRDELPNATVRISQATEDERGDD